MKEKLNLEQARKQNKLKEFIEQHASAGDNNLFKKTLSKMAKKSPEHRKDTQGDS
jgi:hypothetical protein